MIFRRLNQSGIALFPNKVKVAAVIDKLREIFRSSQNRTAYELISILNPIIRGWANYFNMGNSSKFRDYVRQALYRFVWIWCRSKHKGWGEKAIANKYFKDPNGRKFKNRLWTFRGMTYVRSRYTYKEKTIYLQDPSNCSAILASKHYIIPNEIIQIHGFDKDYKKLIDFKTSLNLKASGIHSTLKDRLMIRQSGKCLECNNPITPKDIQDGSIHIHHIIPISKRGSRNNITNLVLLHSWCHYNIDHTIEVVAGKGK
jgi:RNA-directed DNA polymerase